MRTIKFIFFFAFASNCAHASQVPNVLTTNSQGQTNQATNNNNNYLATSYYNGLTTAMTPNSCPAGETLTGAVYSQGRVYGGTCSSVSGVTHVPTRQVFTSGSGIYVSTASTGLTPIEIIIRMLGGGGGGSAVTSNSGVAGSSTVFNSIYAAGGGGGQVWNNTTGSGAGGIGGCNGSGSASLRICGGNGGSGGSTYGNSIPGYGGSSAFGGSAGSAGQNIAGNSAPANGGGGGAAGNQGYTGNSQDGSTSGGGGGAGEYVELIISNPVSTYSYTVGSGGAGGNAGTYAGGNGGSGIIIVDEYYSTGQSFSIPNIAYTNQVNNFTSSQTISASAFSVGNSTFVVNNGNVGIDVSSPKYPLEVGAFANFDSSAAVQSSFTAVGEITSNTGFSGSGAGLTGIPGSAVTSFGISSLTSGTTSAQAGFGTLTAASGTFTGSGNGQSSISASSSVVLSAGIFSGPAASISGTVAAGTVNAGAGTITSLNATSLSVGTVTASGAAQFSSMTLTGTGNSVYALTTSTSINIGGGNLYVGSSAGVCWGTNCQDGPSSVPLGGAAGLSSTQTFTGANTFTSSVTLANNNATNISMVVVSSFDVSSVSVATFTVLNTGFIGTAGSTAVLISSTNYHLHCEILNGSSTNGDMGLLFNNGATLLSGAHYGEYCGTFTSGGGYTANAPYTAGYMVLHGQPSSGTMQANSVVMSDCDFSLDISTPTALTGHCTNTWSQQSGSSKQIDVCSISGARMSVAYNGLSVAQFTTLASGGTDTIANTWSGWCELLAGRQHVE